jgi:hypothetical protein
VAAAVQVTVGPLAPAIEPPVDTIAFVVEPLSRDVLARSVGPIGCAIQSLVDAIAAVVRTPLDSVAFSVEALLDTIAAPIESVAAIGYIVGQQLAAQHQQADTDPCRTASQSHDVSP